VYKLIPLFEGYRERVIYSFQGGASDGQSPGGLTKVGDRLFGTTELGAGGCDSQGCGVAYMLSPSHAKTGYTEQILYTFESDGGALVYPAPGIAATKHGTRLFGAAQEGKNLYGGVFEIDL
jgi:hypothetical protein